MKRRIFAVLLVLAMLMSLLPVYVFAEDNTTVIDSGSCGENLTWTFSSDGVLTISGSGPMSDYGAHGSPWYEHKDQMVEIVVEDGVTTIGSAAFYDCYEVKVVSLPNSVTTIMDRAFYNCVLLNSIDLPDALTFIGWNAFWWCTSLESIEFPDTLETIEYDAFSYCDSLTQIHIPASVTQIDSGAFYNCHNLSAFSVDANNPNYVSDNYGVLLSKDGKTLIQIPTTYQGAYTVPAGVTCVGDLAAAYCVGLTEVNFPAGLEQICDRAFRGCIGLKSIILPAGITTVNYGAFEECSALQSVLFLGNAPEFSYNSFRDSAVKGFYPANNATWTEDYLSSHSSFMAFEPLTLPAILVQPENVQALPNQTVSVSVKAYGTDLTYKWFVAAAGSDYFGETDIAGDTYSAMLNSYTVGLQVYCLVTDGAGNTVQSNTITLGYPAQISAEEYASTELQTEGQVAYFTFIPQYSCGYQVEVSTGMNTLVCVYDEYMNLLASGECESIGALASDFYEGSVYFITVQYADPKEYGWLDIGVFHNNVNYRSEITTAATCSFEGIKTNYCNFCDHTWTETYIADHDYVDGYCTMCGEKKPIGGPCGDDLIWKLNDFGELIIRGSGAMDDYSLYSLAPWYEYRDSIYGIYFDGDITTIGDYAFYECDNLSSVDIPNSVTTIGEGAFNGCNGLEEISFGENVSSIGVNAFWNCDSLTSVSVPSKVTTLESGIFGNCTSLSAVTIPEGVTTIGKSAFDGCTALKAVELPDSLTTIGQAAFEVCSSLASVTIGDQVTEIGAYAFAECGALKEVTMGDSVASIGEYAFRYCTELTTVHIPASVTSIEERAFDHCPALTDVYIDDLAAWMNISYGSQFAHPLSANDNSKKLYLDGVLLTEVVIPDDVTAICDYAFYNCASVERVSIPDSVTHIGDYAFAGCTALDGIDIPKDVSYIGYSAFERCSALTSVLIPAGVSEIHNATFSECSSLKSVTIPNTVTSIGTDAFGHCESLEQITIPDSVTTISDFAFWNCTALKGITIPASVTSIAGYAFYNCTAMEAVTFLGDAPTIDGSAFTNVEVKVSYPADNETWTEDVLQNYGGNVTWVDQGATVNVPTLSLVAPALNFEDEIYYNIYYTVSDMTDVVEMGLITFNASTPDGTVENADAVIPGYVQSGANYMSHTNGIPAKMLGDALYFKAYAKLSDGSYVYSGMQGYHAVAYAKDILANSSNAKMKALVVAMLNYGAAAQVHFDYKTDALVNSFLTDDQKALIDTYSSDMVEGLTKVDTAKVGAFAGTGGYKGIAPNVVFEGAFAINLYFTAANSVDSNVKLYYWTLDDYNAAETLTAENATGVVVTEETSTAGQYVGAITGIAAKQIDQTVFFCAVYESNGTSYCSGVFSYSLASYCLDRVANGSATMQEFAKETIVYGYYAKAYFA